jgi:anti-anti-sigma factor
VSLNAHSYQEDVPQDGGSAYFAVQHAVSGGEHTVVLTGELDLASAPELGATVARIRMSRSTALVLDLRKLAFIDSAGIRAVLVIRELCAERQCGFMLIPGQRQVQRVFEICGLLDHLPFRADAGRVAPDTSATAP